MDLGGLHMGSMQVLAGIKAGEWKRLLVEYERAPSADSDLLWEEMVAILVR